MTGHDNERKVDRSRLALLGALIAAAAVGGCPRRVAVSNTEQWQDNARDRNRFLQTGELPGDPPADPRTGGGGAGGGGGGGGGH
jgi:hypothetical protein